MTIAELRERSNRAISGLPRDLLLLSILLLCSAAAFGLGILADRELRAGKGTGFSIETMATATPAAALAALPATSTARRAPLPMNSPGAAVQPSAGKYVASKNGTKYYLPSCASAARIKEENRVWFATQADAEASGRTPATNCPGL